MSHNVRLRRVITILFLTAVLLSSGFGMSSVPAAQAQQGGTVSLSGWFSIRWGDRQDGATQELPVLSTDDGQSVRLLLDDSAAESAGGLLALDRKHITVHGAWAEGLNAQGGPQTFNVTSVAPLAEADVASAAVTGTKKWISIMCKFQGNASEPRNLAYFQDMYKSTFPGLDHYWREVSYNLINTVGSTASGWYVLPHNHDYYMSGGWFDLDLAAKECTSVANPSINFVGIDGINLMFNGDLDGYAWGGGANLTLDGISKYWNMTWEPPWGYENVGVLGHEMGHAFGLPHSSGNYGQTYDNEWDVMSDHWAGCYGRGFSDATYGCYGQHTISYHKDKLGWIPAAQKTSVGAGTAKTVVLERLALPQTTNLKLVRIPIGGSNTHFYTVEARQLAGYDEQLPGNAVVIHDVDTQRYASPAHVIDVDNNGVTGDAGAMWLTGEVFRNNTYKISVAVLGRTASGFKVYVASGVTRYYISGSLGVGNVTINYTGGSTTTDDTGKYIIPVPAGWSGTIKPSKAGYSFTPASRSYSNVTSDKTAQNFNVLLSISGDAGVAGTTLSYFNGTNKKVVASTTGNYSLKVPKGWSGIVTPSHPCFSFTPANRGYTNLANSETAQDYGFSLSDPACANVGVWVNVPERGRFGLLPGGSVRASFPGLDSGSVEIASFNSKPLVAAERVIYKVNGVNTSFSEMMGLPSGQLDQIYWLPWYNSKDLDTQIRIGNAANAVANVEIFIAGQSMGSFTVNPYSGARKSFPNVDKGPVKIVSDTPIVVSERVIYKVNGVATSFTEMMALPNKQIDTTFLLPWYNNKDIDTQLRIANTTNTATTFSVTIAGVPVANSPFNLPANGSVRLSFPNIDKGPVMIQSSVNIIASERVIHKVNGVSVSFSEMMGLPFNQVAQSYWLPWYNTKDLDTQIRAANLGANPATVHVLVGGQEVTGSPFQIPLNGSIRKSFPNIDKGPVQILSNTPIVVSERVIYSVNGVATSFTEMLGLPESILSTSNWLPWYNNKDLDTQLRFAVPVSAGPSEPPSPLRDAQP